MENLLIVIQRGSRNRGMRVLAELRYNVLPPILKVATEFGALYQSRA